MYCILSMNFICVHVGSTTLSVLKIGMQLQCRGRDLGNEFLDLGTQYFAEYLGYKDTAGTSILVLISEGPYKQPRITKNNFGRDMFWGVPIS
jgi:hypothetical protein